MKTFAETARELHEIADAVRAVELRLLVEGVGDAVPERLAAASDLDSIASGLSRAARRAEALANRYDPAPGELQEAYGS